MTRNINSQGGKGNGKRSVPRFSCSRYTRETMMAFALMVLTTMIVVPAVQSQSININRFVTTPAQTLPETPTLTLEQIQGQSSIPVNQTHTTTVSSTNSMNSSYNSSSVTTTNYSSSTSSTSTSGWAPPITIPTTTTSTSTRYQNRQSYKFLTIEEAQRDEDFNIVNQFMLKGDYKHYISRSVLPIQSVFLEYQMAQSEPIKQFKILYEGSGASLLMCIISIVPSTKAIKLKSFVTIGQTRVVDGCVDYSFSLQCIRCAPLYQLVTTTSPISFRKEIECRAQIPGCAKYWNNICLECEGWKLLVNNSCMSECDVLSDTRRFLSGGCSALQSMLLSSARLFTPFL